jgi:maltose alpha-D-glucosyltransferase/alpha-amylase
LIDLWYNNAVLYSLDVGTFADGNADGVGDFRGLSDHLPYLAGIGITCVWLLPFYPSPRRAGCDYAETGQPPPDVARLVVERQ